MAGHQRIEWLDGMKGIGILIVMLSHFCSLPLIFKAGYMPLFSLLQVLHINHHFHILIL